LCFVYAIKIETRWHYVQGEQAVANYVEGNTSAKSSPAAMMGQFFMAFLFFWAVLAATARPSNAAGPITTPKEHFGFNMGDDYCLANYKQLMTYWAKLEKESDRIRLVDIGKTEEGRPELMCIVSSPANIKNLAHYQDIAKRLARAKGIDEAQARQLATEGKAVVWIDGGLHASEVLCAQALIESVYRMLSSSDPETLRFLDDVIILFVHANPDGMDLCADWYMREKNPQQRSLGGLPRLYQKYIGHDNNRDFYACTQAETKNMNRVMYTEWFPQIVYNHHQTGPPGAVLFCPPFRDPFNYNVDPLVISGIDAVGAAMMERFLEEGKPGATSRSGARYSTWFNGGLRTTTYFHNMIGLLTETIGSPTPSSIPFNPAMQLPKADYLAPIAPQTWHFRQSVEYSVTANKAVLDYASRNRERLLRNMWLMGKNAIERGNRDSWTTTPKVVAAARREGGSGPAVRAGVRRGGSGGAANFAKLFHDPERRDPRGYVIPANQPDFPTATKFLKALAETGVTIHRATSPFEVAGKKYPAGSYVVKCDQAFRAHVLDMFEPQDHPDDFAYPGAPPTAPYDVAGYTLAYQMAVRFDRILDGFTGPFEEVTGPIVPTPATVADTEGAVGFFLAARTNDAFRAVNRLLKAGEEVKRLHQRFTVQGFVHPPGFFYIPRKATTLPALDKIAAELGVRFIGTPAAPGAEAVTLKPVRIGLWDRYGGSMPSGWTRWVFEQFEFPYQLVFAPQMDKGGLNDKFDVIVLADGAVPQRGGGGGGRGGRGGRGGGGGGGDVQPDEPGPAGVDASLIPPEYRGQQGNITPEKTIPELRKFLENGGTILAVGSSCNLANQLGLPVTNHLVTKDKEPLGREKFYVPGSVLSVKLDPSNSLAWGLDEHVDVFFSGSPAFDFAEGAEAKGLKKVAWYDSKTPLRSGWAWGQENLDGGIGIIDAKVGKGRLALFGPQITFRGQPHGTFKFLFNGIVEAGAVAK
jgi:Zinc carboxypeptidase